MSPAENSEAIVIPFAFRTRVDPGKYLLYTADCFGRILYCVHSTQYGLLVLFCLYLILRAVGVGKCLGVCVYIG